LNLLLESSNRLIELTDFLLKGKPLLLEVLLFFHPLFFQLIQRSLVGCFFLSKLAFIVFIYFFYFCSMVGCKYLKVFFMVFIEKFDGRVSF